MARPAPVALNPPPPLQPDYQAANSVASKAPCVVNQVGEPVYERFQCRKPLQFGRTHDPVTAEEWIKHHQHIFGYYGER